MKYLISIIFVLISSQALAHSWYDAHCCHDKDCAPITQRKELDNGDIEVTTQHGTVIVPKLFQRKPSQDGDEHVCMRMTETGKMSPICYYVPGGS